MFRIATAAYSCCPLCSDSSRSCASCLLTAPMQAPSSTTVPAQRCAVWWSRLSNALMAPRALSSNPSVGSLSAPLPGSTAAGGSPRTGKIATTTPSPSSPAPPSASCSDGSVILHEVFGRTLSGGAAGALAGHMAGHGFLGGPGGCIAGRGCHNHTVREQDLQNQHDYVRRRQQFDPSYKNPWADNQ